MTAEYRILPRAGSTSSAQARHLEAVPGGVRLCCGRQRLKGRTSRRLTLGVGKYEDGSPGSPMLLLGAASKTGSFRTVECVFVERDRANFTVLSEVVQSHGAGLSCSCCRAISAATLRPS